MITDIGIASYKSNEKLVRSVNKIVQNTVGEWRLHIVDNSPPDDPVRKTIASLAVDKRITYVFNDTNRGYAGAVNQIFDWTLTQPESWYVTYCDNDAYVETRGWDLKMTQALEAHRDIGIFFPNGGAYPIPMPGGYSEVLWGVGFFWMLRKDVLRNPVRMDESLGHQEEADLQTQIRLAGYAVAAEPSIIVRHEGTTTANPAAQERIRNGVVNWVTKWNRRFYGANQGYHSPNVLRHEEWGPNRLYMERYWQHRLPGINNDPEVIKIDGVEYDMIKTPRLKNYYRGRCP